MSVPIERTGFGPQTFVPGLSRYLDSQVIYYDVGRRNVLTFETYVRRPYTPQGDEKILLISKPHEYRPDLVAFKVYRTSDVWWRILEANGMKDVWDFKAGKTIILPNLYQ